LGQIPQTFKNVSCNAAILKLNPNPVGKIAKKAVYRSVFLTKNALLQTVSLAILPTGNPLSDDVRYTSHYGDVTLKIASVFFERRENLQLN